MDIGEIVRVGEREPIAIPAAPEPANAPERPGTVPAEPKRSVPVGPELETADAG